MASKLSQGNRDDPALCPREQKRRRRQFQLLLPRSGGLRFPQRQQATWRLRYKMPARLCRMTERMAIA